MDKPKMTPHIELLGWINIVGGALGLPFALLIFVFLVGLAPVTGDPVASNVLMLVGTVVPAFIVLLCLPGIIEGVGLLKRRPWARPLGLVLGVFNLFNFPIGTVVAVYSFWVLTQEDTTTLLAAPA